MPSQDQILDDVVATFEFASAELGSKRLGMAVAMRAYALSVGGQVELTPHQLILECVCEVFDVTLPELLGPSQKHNVARARRAAQWLLKANGYSYSKSAEHTGRKTSAEAYRSCQAVKGDDELQREIGAVAGMIADRLPTVKGAPVIWPRARVA